MKISDAPSSAYSVYLYPRRPMVAAPLVPMTRRELVLSTITIFSTLIAITTKAATPRTVVATKPAAASTTFTAAGRTVIVTGASRGIGKGIALVFAEAGANVLVTSRHLVESQATAQEIIDGGGIASAFEGDVSVEADVQRMVATAVERYGGVDIVCANAGVIPDAPIATLDTTDFDETFAVNMRGTFLSVKHALPYLQKSSAGRVVLTSSITGPITGFPGWSHYGATKAAQLGFMRSAAMELAAFGVTINAVMPGNIITEGLAALGDDYLRNTEAVIPLGHLGVVRDIGYAALYLASAEANFITGTTLVVDGGQTIPEQPSFRDKW